MLVQPGLGLSPQPRHPTRNEQIQVLCLERRLDVQLSQSSQAPIGASLGSCLEGRRRAIRALPHDLTGAFQPVGDGYSGREVSVGGAARPPGGSAAEKCFFVGSLLASFALNQDVLAEVAERKGRLFLEAVNVVQAISHLAFAVGSGQLVSDLVKVASPCYCVAWGRVQFIENMKRLLCRNDGASIEDQRFLAAGCVLFA